MIERPILFSGAMVRAILAGEKTQTRRVVKPQPEVTPDGYLAGKWLSRPLHGLLRPKVEDIVAHSPYGRLGERLWVRETAWYDRSVCSGLPGLRCFFEGDDVRHQDGRVGKAPFASTAEILDLNDSLKKVPSIHMPRWACRIVLEVTDVRVERLQAITEPDAIAEGATPEPHGAGSGRVYEERTPYRAGYAVLWDSLNAGRGLGWHTDPFVWVVSFRRVNAG
jgi:hypothetical protein